MRIKRIERLPDLSDLATVSRAEGYYFIDRLRADFASGKNCFAQPGEVLFVGI